MNKEYIEFFKENIVRYRKLMKGEKVDYAPFRLWIDDTFICEYTKTDPKVYAENYEVMIGAQKVVNERFYDQYEFFASVNYFDIFFDREKFQQDYPNLQQNNFLEPSLDNFDRYFCKKKFIDVPGVKKLIECIKFYNNNLPKHKHVNHYYGIWGVMDLFSIFRGTENFFIDLYENTNKVHEIFSYITERSLQWLEFAKNMWEGKGSDNLLYDKLDIGEDYSAYLSPDLFNEFEMPYTGKLISENNNIFKSLHSDGDFHLENMKMLKDFGIDEFMGFTPNMDIKTVRSILPDMILAGNIHPFKVMNYGTPEDVKAAAKYCFEQANQNQKFVLCTGGAICAGAKPENIDAFLESAYEIVKY